MQGYVVRFFLILSALFGAETTLWAQESVIIPWTGILAAAAAQLAQVFQPSTVAHGLVLSDPATGFGVVIAPGCNGVEAVLMLAAAMLAFPVSWTQKAVGVAAGFLAIQGLNVLRIVSLFALGQWSRPMFDIAHLYAWQALIMLDVLVVFFMWVRHVKTRPVAAMGAPA